MLWRNFPDIYI